MHNMERGLGPKLTLNYSAGDHEGFKNVYPTIIIGQRAVPITDWTIAAQH